MSKKKIHEHCWDEASQKKKKIRIKNLKPIDASSRLLRKKFESTSKLHSTSNVKLNGMLTENAG